MVFLSLKLQENRKKTKRKPKENQKKTEENRRKPEEKKTTAPPKIADEEEELGTSGHEVEDFLLSLAVAINHYLSRVILLF